MWSIKRPGVAITTSGCKRNAASWDFKSKPPNHIPKKKKEYIQKQKILIIKILPVERQAVILWANCVNWRKTWWIWTHNSRVGAKTSTRVHGAVWWGL